MEAEVIEEDDRGIGVRVVDNNSVEHTVAVGFDGEIQGHSQDGYPDDPSKRTHEGNEHVEQARRYARYHVYREREYETVARRDLPEVVAAVGVTVASLSTDEFDEQFGAYYQQFRSTFEADVEPVVDPPGAGDDGTVVYLQNVYLDVDPIEILDDEQTEELLESLETEASLDNLDSRLGQEFVSIDTLLNPANLSVQTSGLGTIYQTETDESITEPTGALDRPADARLELPPKYDGEEGYLSLDAFQFLVFHHLICQVRDCYLRLGLEPPEAVCVLGGGKYRQTIRNEYLDMYRPVHDTASPVEGYRLPGLGTHLDV